MQTIIKKKNEYHEDPINAIITNQIIIPGISGQEIDIENSYQKMKKLGTYNENLLVYQTISPKISYQNNFDKIIIPRKNNNIALIFLIENQNIFNNINTILKNNNTIGNILNNSFLINNTNFKNTISTNSHADYCLTYNLNINNECVINKKYTILSKLKPINKYHLTTTKENINNNNIFIYNFSDNTLNNLPLIIKYLKNNQYNIVSIEELIKE